MTQRPLAPPTPAPRFGDGESLAAAPRPRRAWLASVLLHLTFGTLLVTVDWPQPAPRDAWDFPRVTLDSQKLVFRAPERELPPISAAKTDSAQGRGEIRAGRRVTVRDPEPDSALAKLSAPAPKLPMPPAPAADVLSPPAKLPRVTPPRFEPRPTAQAAAPEPTLEAAPEIETAAPESAPLPPSQFRLRYQQQQTATAQPTARPLHAPAAPSIAPQAPDVETLADATPRVRFWRDTTQPTDDPAPAPLDATAPGIAAAGPDAPTSVITAPSPKLRYQERGAGSAPAAPGETALAPQAAPPIAASAPSEATALPVGAPGPARFRPEFQPGASAGRTAPTTQALPAGGAAPAPALTPGNGDLAELSGQLARLRINLRPPNAPATPPSGSQSAAFSTAPDADGRPGKLFQNKGAVAPNVSVEAPPRRNPSTGDPAANPADALRQRFRARDPGPVVLASASIQQPPAAFDTPPGAAPPPPPANPEAFFTDRRSYEMSIQMPNVSSYSGSWQIRFAELGTASAKEDDSPPAQRLSAPQPRKKVDPKYDRSAAEAGVEGEVWLTGIIFEDGEIAQIRVVKGIDSRLDRSARQALEQWQFQPARRGQTPVAVEVVVTIPFRLTALTP